ncbi:MAG: MBL fold metallo-hydrolase [Myxococcaceae bacterium]|nr:MBL fold metallo-hydrolase [Myxococcaceae bacterium]
MVRTPSLLVALVSSSVLAGQLHVFTSDDAGFNTHSVWYDDGQEVTVVDTQFTPAHAQTLVEAIRAKTKSPITRVIVTHPNPDKFNALSVFHALGAVSIASKKTAAAMPGVDAYKRFFWTKVAKAFTDETYPKVEPVKQTFEKQLVVTLTSKETLTLIELPEPGVSSSQTVVRIDRTGDLIVGDLVAHQAHAWLEGGIVDGKPRPTLDGWRKDLKLLPTLGAGTLYGGRGAFGPVKQVVAAQLAYLDTAERLVTQIVASHTAAELADADRSKAIFAEIQQALVKAFPQHAHPDLVGYGVYGLAASKPPKAR